jgi:hypothetical protein
MFVEVDMWFVWLKGMKLLTQPETKLALLPSVIWLKGMNVFVHESTKGEFDRAFSFTLFYI